MPRKRVSNEEKAVQLSLDFEEICTKSIEQSTKFPVKIFSQKEPLNSKSLLQIQALPPNRNIKQRQKYSPEYLKSLQEWYRQSWSQVFYEAVPLEWKLHFIYPLLSLLKSKRARGSYWSGDYLLNVHRLEKDLIYLVALTIAEKCQLFISFPISPVAIGILTIAYYAHLSRDARDKFTTNHAITSKSFVIWIRPQDNGQIQNLKITTGSNLGINLNERLLFIPVYRFQESDRDNRLRVVTVRSLSEGINLLQNSQYCSLVVLDDPSGKTHLLHSKYGDTAFELAKLCKTRKIPMIGIVPPWTMQVIEERENNSKNNILLWPIDDGALRSYPIQPSPFAKSEAYHPIEESYQLINKRYQLCVEPQVTIKTFSFDIYSEDKIADAFQEASDLLIEISKQPELRNIWSKGWEILRDLSAPILPSHLLWEKFLQGSLQQLGSAVQRSGEQKALALYPILNSLAQRIQKLTSNPFIQIIETLDNQTIVAVEGLARADALNKFLSEHCNSSRPKITTINELHGQGGKKLVVIGQPKARHRDLLQITFFHQVDVLLWAVLAKRAEAWWSGLEIDSRGWHAKTWQTLTGQTFGGRYEYSYRPNFVETVHIGKTKLHKSVDLSKLEENFGELSGASLDSGLDRSTAKNLNAHYLVKFNENLSIRVSPNSEFLVKSRNHVQVISVRDINIGTKVVLFEGMNRDELFAQKVGLLEETKDNWLYRMHLEGWRTLIKQSVEQSDLSTVCRRIFRDTSIPISEAAIQYWMSGDDMLSLPREKSHFFCFFPPQVQPLYQEFWQKANTLRDRRRQLGRVISTCAQQGWRERNSDEIVFQYQRIFITVGELREAMQVLTVKFTPQFIQEKPEYPLNRLFRTGV